MTLKQWQMIAGFCILAAFVVLVVSVRAKTRAEQDAAHAAVLLDSVTTKLHDAQALARAGVTQSAAYRQRIDSLWSVIRAVQYAPPVRQRSVRIVDTADVVEVVAEMQTLRAERDTALNDLAVVTALLDSTRATADALRIAALEHIREDSVRFAGIEQAVASATDDARKAQTAIRPRWWTRLGRGVVATVKTVGLVAIGYGAGRL